MMKTIAPLTCFTVLLTCLTMTACNKDNEPKQSPHVEPQAASAVESTPQEFMPAIVKNISSLRPKTAIDQERMPQPLAITENTDQRKTRVYPMQPPTIPHRIDGYQIDLKANQCMSCHSRNQTEESGAIMVSVTHYMDRGGNFLAEVSPRRYFCTQCHIVQTNAKPLVKSDFIDMHSLSVSADKDLR